MLLCAWVQVSSVSFIPLGISLGINLLRVIERRLANVSSDTLLAHPILGRPCALHPIYQSPRPAPARENGELAARLNRFLTAAGESSPHRPRIIATTKLEVQLSVKPSEPEADTGRVAVGSEQ